MSQGYNNCGCFNYPKEYDYKENNQKEYDHKEKCCKCHCECPKKEEPKQKCATIKICVEEEKKEDKKEEKNDKCNGCY